MITKNKGEWSELYVFLKLLGDGVLYAADADLNKIDDLYYPIIEILRKENEQVRHYVKNDIKINIKDNSNNILLELPATEFEKKAIILINEIKKGHSTFAIPVIEKFMDIIKCTKVKAPALEKSDITIVLHDCKTFKNELFSFSIKSDLGMPPTLFNSGTSTNFTYEIIGNMSNEEMNKINSINSKFAKLRNRINTIYELGYDIKFSKLEHRSCQSNLQMIDTKMPEILAEYVLLYFSGKGRTISELTPLVRQINPCDFDLSSEQKYYEHKIKTFLTDCALGMTAAKPWDGRFQATGGHIIVKKDGEVLCYHIYNRNEFRDYLFKNTRLETPDAKRHGFGTIYQENGKNYIKLNLQVRFI